MSVTFILAQYCRTVQSPFPHTSAGSSVGELHCTQCMMEKNANYMHTEYTMVPSDHRNDMHWCQLRFNSPPLHYTLMTKKKCQPCI